MLLVSAWVRQQVAAEQGRFVLWLPVFMASGILVYYNLTVEPAPWLGAKFALAGFAAAAATAARPLLRAFALSLAFLALGFAAAQFASARAPPLEAVVPAHAVLVSGTVRAVESLPAGRRVTLAGVVLTIAGEPDQTLHRMVRIRLKSGDETPIGTGDAIRVRALLRTPSPPALPGGWDTQFDAFFAGIGASGYALDRIGAVVPAAPDRWAARVQRLRETIAARVQAAIPGAPGAVAVTLLTGASRGIPEADHEAFRNSGLAHLLAVAGLHIGIVMGFALLLARTLLALSERASLFWPTKQIAALFALACGALYMVLTGAHVPIVRSFAMACLVTLAIVAGRRPLSIRGLGLAGIVLMLIAPNEVTGVSFQMSFSAVLALIAGYEALRPWLRRLHGRTLARRLSSHAAALALTSALAGTASLPFGAYHFGHVQIYYVLSNMVAVPLTALWVMPAGMAALLLMPFGLEPVALVPMGWGSSLIIATARFTAALPDAQIAVPHIPSWGLAVLSLGMAWLGIWRTRVRLLGVGLILGGLASPAFDRPPDILVSADAGLIGFRTGQGVFLHAAHGAEAFVRDAWLGRWFVPAARALPADGEAASGAVRCVRDYCLFQPRSEAAIALLARGASRPSDCHGVAIVVSPEPARGVCRHPYPLLADRFTVWKDGPVAIWLTPNGARMLTDRASRGDRPWVTPPPKPKPRPVSTLPLAPVDEGGADQ